MVCKSKKDLLTRAAYMTNSETETTLFLSTFADENDATIATILCSWMTNGVNGEFYAIQRFIESEMCNAPTEYVLDYLRSNKWANRGIESFYGVLTYKNLHKLLVALGEIYSQWDTFADAYTYHTIESRIERKKYKYAYEILATMLGKENGFPTRTSNCAFFRYNLVFYYLYHQLHLWKGTSEFLLPCNDAILARAYDLGIVTSKMKTKMRSVRELSDVARDWFGDDDLFQMYDLLTFYNG